MLRLNFTPVRRGWLVAVLSVHAALFSFALNPLNAHAAPAAPAAAPAPTAVPPAVMAHAVPVDSEHVTAPDTIAQRMAACAGCHGKEGRATPEGYYPRIAGKPAGYLYNQLVNFREGHRTYPIMTYMVGYMTDEYLREVAEYFSQQNPPFPPPSKVDASTAVLKRGEDIVRNGDAAKGIPACAQCHGAALTGVNPATPGLLGLPRSYLVAQLGGWKNGQRHANAPDCMAQVAAKLSSDDIGAVSSWLASQPVPVGQGALPVPPLQVPLPMQCGSIPH